MAQQRKTRTKEDIKRALTRLLIRKDFSEITVSNLTKEAGINRGTFYLHYQDKYDLIDKIIDDIFSEVMDQLPLDKDREDWLPHVEYILGFVRDDYDFVSALVSSRSDYISDVLRDFLMNLIDRVPLLQEAMRNQDDLTEDYAKEVFISSNIGIILHWIRKGCKEPIEMVAKMFLRW